MRSLQQGLTVPSPHTVRKPLSTLRPCILQRDIIYIIQPAASPLFSFTQIPAGEVRAARTCSALTAHSPQAVATGALVGVTVVAPGRHDEGDPGDEHGDEGEDEAQLVEERG